MSKIVEIETEYLATKLTDENFITTYGTEPSIKTHVIVRITSNDGFSGIGESCPLPDFSGETSDTIKLMIDKYYAHILLNKDPFNLEALHQELDRQFPANNSAKAAIDMALHDLVGKTLDVPVYKLLGGLCRTKVDTCEALGMGEPLVLAQKAEQFLKLGIKAVKLKVGVDLQKDIETVKTVRDIVGDDFNIRIDANEGYSLNTAVKVLKKIERWDIEYVEQPIAAWDYDGLNFLRKSVDIPIMVDESICTIVDAVKLIQSRAADLFGLKLIKHGGIFKTTKIATLAECNDIECVLISPWETQIGVAAALHIALSSPNFKHPQGIGLGALQDDPTSGLYQKQGALQIPSASGLGISYKFQRD
ncbi:MAG: mandelate racemase/muconate lactonizing enzyme family protein [Candidatus Hodarchaeales archaeon]